VTFDDDTKIDGNAQIYAVVQGSETIVNTLIMMILCV